LPTKVTTIENVDNITGEAETFILQTIQREDGYHVVLKYMDKSGTIRIILPPKVSSTIVAHRDSLAARRRSAVSRATMKRRMDEGFVPKPPKRKKR
jgi:hypothetical protein